MTTSFTNEEYANMLLVYGAANCNGREAQRLYQERYPNRRLPSHQTFATTYRRLRETGNLRYQEPRVNVRQHHVATDERVLEVFNNNPNKSIREVAAMLGLGIWKVWAVLRENRQHAFHYTPVQDLQDNDFGRRVEFCRHLLHTDVEDENFLRSILWTDESKFDKEGISNYHNLHYWAPKNQNPRVKRPRKFQRRFSVNVWAGVIGNKLIGPHYLPDNINGNNYLEFLQNDLPGLVEEVLQEDRPFVFQHDGCPAHWSTAVREYLNNVFPNSWIGRGGPIPWPPRSPDLTPIDFYVWGRAKELVYATVVPSREQLIIRINEAFEKMKAEMIFQTTTVEILKRCRACIRSQGHQFEQLL